jgi:hypothetical protein
MADKSEVTNKSLNSPLTDKKKIDPDEIKGLLALLEKLKQWFSKN